jgi:hypothetical protein
LNTNTNTIIKTVMKGPVEEPVQILINYKLSSNNMDSFFL